MNMDDNKSKSKGGDIMGAISKPQNAFAITHGMTRPFVDMLASQKRPDDYWEECKKSKKSISSTNMEKMKKLCNGE